MVTGRIKEFQGIASQPEQQRELSAVVEK